MGNYINIYYKYTDWLKCVSNLFKMLCNTMANTLSAFGSLLFEWVYSNMNLQFVLFMFGKYVYGYTHTCMYVWRTLVNKQ